MDAQTKNGWKFEIFNSWPNLKRESQKWQNERDRSGDRVEIEDENCRYGANRRYNRGVTLRIEHIQFGHGQDDAGNLGMGSAAPLTTCSTV